MPITTGTRLERLQRLRARLDHEIAAEEGRTARGETRTPPPTPKQYPDPTPEGVPVPDTPDSDWAERTVPQILAHFHVTNNEVKDWARHQGFHCAVTGRARHDVAVAYAEHHTTEGNRPA